MKKSQLTVLLMLAISSSLVLGACKKKKEETPQPTNNDKGASATPPKEETPKKAEFSPTKDAEVVTALQAVLDNCDTKYVYGRECKADEQKNLDKLMRKKRLDALDTLLALVLDEKSDMKLRKLAAYELDYHMKHSVSDIASGKKKANEATGDALLKAVSIQEPSRENRIPQYLMPTAVHYNNLLLSLIHI